MQETEAVLRAKEVARKTGLSLSAVWYKTNPKRQKHCRPPCPLRVGQPLRPHG